MKKIIKKNNKKYQNNKKKNKIYNNLIKKHSQVKRVKSSCQNSYFKYKII